MHAQKVDLSSFIHTDEKEKKNTLNLAVEGMHCASCAWRIESTLNSEQDVQARVNFSTNRLVLNWRGDKERGNDLVTKATDLGFKFAPSESDNSPENAEERFLLKCIAVAGFASGNIMLFSFALWFSTQSEMGTAT